MMMMMIPMMIRHEVPVSGEQIEVISMEDDLVVVSSVILKIIIFILIVENLMMMIDLPIWLQQISRP